MQQYAITPTDGPRSLPQRGFCVLALMLSVKRKLAETQRVHTSKLSAPATIAAGNT